MRGRRRRGLLGGRGLDSVICKWDRRPASAYDNNRHKHHGDRANAIVNDKLNDRNERIATSLA
jgi:hypothetical protein